MFAPIRFGIKAFGLTYKATGVSSLISLLNKIYLGTLYPFFQVFLLAKFLDMLSENQSLTFSDIQWLVVAYLVATVFKIVLRSYDVTLGSGFQSRKIDNYLEREIAQKLTTLDPAVFEDPKFQTLLAQMTDVKFNIKNHIAKFALFVESATKVTIAILVLLPTFPIFIPIVMAFTIPSLFAYNNNRKVVLPFNNEKKGSLVRIVRLKKEYCIYNSYY